MGVFFVFGQVLAWPVIAAPKADLWPRWEQHDANSQLSIDHSVWDRFLQKYIVVEGGVHYLRYANVSGEDKSSLAAYIKRLEKTPISRYARKAQLAYWINLYNAKTVSLILEHYPIDSIRSISFGWLNRGPWDEKLLNVESEALSLNDIEHRILRPIWRDPRLHYAVNCASMGCPNLARGAYRPDNLERMLDQGAGDFISHSRGVSVSSGKLTLSSIYDWFSPDFGGSDHALISHLVKYASAERAAQLRAYKGAISYQYDWSLNDASQ